LEKFTDQIRNTWSQTISSNLKKVAFKSVVVSGMGGSSNAGKIIQSLIEGESPFPFFVFNDYGLPAWVGKDTLVILNTYSGNTEETLSAYEVAKSNDAKIVAVTSGGKASEMIKDKKVQGVVIDPKDTNPTGFPKSGLGVSLGALLGVLSKLEVLTITEKELFESLKEIDEISNSWNPKEMAEWLNGSLPVLLAARTFVGPLNAGRNAMCEISRNFTQFYDFPEMNHVLIEALEKPDTAKSNKYLYFESKFDNERVSKRFEATKRIMDEMNLKYKTREVKGETLLTQCLEIPYFCALVAYNLSLLQKEDPGPEPWIIKLKKELGQPTH